MIRNILICASLGFFGIVGWAYGQNAPASVVKLPQNIEFKGLPGAPQSAVLYGDLTKPGVFVQRIKFAAGIQKYKEVLRRLEESE